MLLKPGWSRSWQMQAVRRIPKSFLLSLFCRLQECTIPYICKNSGFNRIYKIKKCWAWYSRMNCWTGISYLFYHSWDLLFLWFIFEILVVGRLICQNLNCHLVVLTICATQKQCRKLWKGLLRYLLWTAFCRINDVLGMINVISNHNRTVAISS